MILTRVPKGCDCKCTSLPDPANTMPVTRSSARQNKRVDTMEKGEDKVKRDGKVKSPVKKTPGT